MPRIAFMRLTPKERLLARLCHVAALLNFCASATVNPVAEYDLVSALWPCRPLVHLYYGRSEPISAVIPNRKQT